MVIRVQDLDVFTSNGWGYLGHVHRTHTSDTNLVEAANQLGIQKEDLARWCDSSLARHRMDGASEKLLSSPERFKVWLRKDLMTVNSGDPGPKRYTKQMEKALGSLGIEVRDGSVRKEDSSAVREVLKVIAMSNLDTRDTGVRGAVVWVSVGEFEGKNSRHGPRIKVMLGSRVTSEGLVDSVSVTLENPPRVLGRLPGRIEREVLEFIKINRDTLLGYWGGKIRTRDLLDLLKPIGGG